LTNIGGIQIATIFTCTLCTSVANPDPGSSVFLPPGSGMKVFRITGSRIPDPGFVWLWLILRLCSWKHKKQEKSKVSCRIRDPEWKKCRVRIRDEKCSDPESGIKLPGSATLLVQYIRVIIWFYETTRYLMGICSGVVPILSVIL
jgi:hypothetical protein